jgi:hypothetical protein
MATSYTEEGKFALLDDGSQNWGSVINGVMEALDAGAELTFTFGEAVSAGDTVSLNVVDGLVYKAASNSETLTPAIGFAPNSVLSGYEGKVRYFGWIDVDTSFSYGDDVSWSPGEPMYPGSIAGRLAKSRYSWANPLGYAKSFTDADRVTRFVIHPEHRNEQLVESLTAEKKIAFIEEIDNGNSGAAATIDWGAGNKQKIVLTDNCVMSFAHPFGVCTVTLKIIQDGTGSRLITWPPTVKWPGGTAPTLTTDAWAEDLICFYHDGLNYYGASSLDYS